MCLCVNLYVRIRVNWCFWFSVCEFVCVCVCVFYKDI